MNPLQRTLIEKTRNDIGLEYIEASDMHCVSLASVRRVNCELDSLTEAGMAVTYGFATVPSLLQGTTNLAHHRLMLKETPSLYRSGSLEGVVIRHDSIHWCEARAKLVRTDFTQAI